MALIVYYSSVTENTKRFFDGVGLSCLRLPVRAKDEPPVVGDWFILGVPTYGGGDMRPSRAIPKQVLNFLGIAENRYRCIGVIASGNVNFNEAFLRAGKLVSERLGVPLLYSFELRGNSDDVVKVRDGVLANWDDLVSMRERQLAISGVEL